MVQGQNLGLAVLSNAQGAKSASDAQNHLLEIAFCGAVRGVVRDGRRGTRKTRIGNCGEISNRLCFLQTPVANARTILKAVQDQADRIEAARNVSDSFEVRGAGERARQIRLFRTDENRGASGLHCCGKGSTVLRLLGSQSLVATPRTENAKAVPGFFTEADNQTGDWQKQSGYYWTGSFGGEALATLRQNA